MTMTAPDEVTEAAEEPEETEVPEEPEAVEQITDPNDPRLQEFWAQAARLAEGYNYCGEYDQIVQKVGGPTRQRFIFTVPVQISLKIAVKADGITEEHARESYRITNGRTVEDEARRIAGSQNEVLRELKRRWDNGQASYFSVEPIPDDAVATLTETKPWRG
jgi:hypothetical protein